MKRKIRKQLFQVLTIDYKDWEFPNGDAKHTPTGLYFGMEHPCGFNADYMGFRDYSPMKLDLPYRFRKRLYQWLKTAKMMKIIKYEYDKKTQIESDKLDKKAVMQEWAALNN